MSVLSVIEKYFFFFFFASQIQTGDTDSVCRENKTLQIQNKAVWLVYKNDMTVSV